MKSIVITGVSSGIGYGTARAFLKKDYFVFGSVRTQDDADRLQRELGGHFSPVFFDVTDEAAIRKGAELVERRLAGGSLVGLVNNAGVAEGGPLLLTPPEQWRRQFEVNVFGQFLVTKAFLPLLGGYSGRPSPPGRIVFISSSSGKIPHLFLGAYTGSKHALEGMARVLRMELQLYKIEVVIIGPGAVNSTIWDKESTRNGAAVFRDTDYAAAVERFQRAFVASGKKGYTVDEAGEKIVRIFERKRPRIRYALVKRRMKKWIFPRLMPPRWLDRKMAKGYGLENR